MKRSEDYKNSTAYKRKVVEGQRSWRDQKYGIEKNHTKVCENINCKKEFQFFGRAGTIKYRQARFCSKPCAKSRQKYWNENSKRYTTICFRYHKKECVVCGENKIVAVHHNDHNRKNNDPVNLIPLCPTHHQYVHSGYKDLVIDKIESYRLKFVEEFTSV